MKLIILKFYAQNITKFKGTSNAEEKVTTFAQYYLISRRLFPFHIMYYIIYYQYTLLYDSRLEQSLPRDYSVKQ